MTVVLHADASGSFSAGLKAIFANGLKELATVAPPYWACYASGYFQEDRSIAEARAVTAACIAAGQERLGSFSHEAGVTAPRFLDQPNIASNRIAAETGTHGLSIIHWTVTKNSVPVSLQVVQAVGGGLDEAELQALSQCHFTPASRDGHPVTADMEMSFQIGL